MSGLGPPTYTRFPRLQPLEMTLPLFPALGRPSNYNDLHLPFPLFPSSHFESLDQVCHNLGGSMIPLPLFLW